MVGSRWEWIPSTDTVHHGDARRQWRARPPAIPAALSAVWACKNALTYARYRGLRLLRNASLAELRQRLWREGNHVAALMADVDEDVRHDEASARELDRPKLTMGVDELSAATAGDAQMVLER